MPNFSHQRNNRNSSRGSGKSERVPNASKDSTAAATTSNPNEASSQKYKTIQNTEQLLRVKATSPQDFLSFKCALKAINTKCESSNVSQALISGNMKVPAYIVVTEIDVTSFPEYATASEEDKAQITAFAHAEYVKSVKEADKLNQSRERFAAMLTKAISIYKEHISASLIIKANSVDLVAQGLLAKATAAVRKVFDPNAHAITKDLNDLLNSLITWDTRSADIRELIEFVQIVVDAKDEISDSKTTERAMIKIMFDLILRSKTASKTYRQSIEHLLSVGKPESNKDEVIEILLRVSDRVVEEDLIKAKNADMARKLVADGIVQFTTNTPKAIHNPKPEHANNASTSETKKGPAVAPSHFTLKQKMEYEAANHTGPNCSRKLEGGEKCDGRHWNSNHEAAMRDKKLLQKVEGNADKKKFKKAVAKAHSAAAAKNETAPPRNGQSQSNTPRVNFKTGPPAHFPYQHVSSGQGSNSHHQRGQHHQHAANNGANHASGPGSDADTDSNISESEFSVDQAYNASVTPPHRQPQSWFQQHPWTWMQHPGYQVHPASQQQAYAAHQQQLAAWNAQQGFAYCNTAKIVDSSDNVPELVSDSSEDELEPFRPPYHSMGTQPPAGATNNPGLYILRDEETGARWVVSGDRQVANDEQQPEGEPRPIAGLQRQNRSMHGNGAVALRRSLRRLSPFERNLRVLYDETLDHEEQLTLGTARGTLDIQTDDYATMQYMLSRTTFQEATSGFSVQTILQHERVRQAMAAGRICLIPRIGLPLLLHTAFASTEPTAINPSGGPISGRARLVFQSSYGLTSPPTNVFALSRQDEDEDDAFHSANMVQAPSASLEAMMRRITMGTPMQNPDALHSHNSTSTMSFPPTPPSFAAGDLDDDDDDEEEETSDGHARIDKIVEQNEALEAELADVSRKVAETLHHVQDSSSRQRIMLDDIVHAINALDVKVDKVAESQDMYATMFMQAFTAIKISMEQNHVEMQQAILQLARASRISRPSTTPSHPSRAGSPANSSSISNSSNALDDSRPHYSLRSSGAAPAMFSLFPTVGDDNFYVHSSRALTGASPSKLFGDDPAFTATKESAIATRVISSAGSNADEKCSMMQATQTSTQDLIMLDSGASTSMWKGRPALSTVTNYKPKGSVVFGGDVQLQKKISLNIDHPIFGAGLVVNDMKQSLLSVSKLGDKGMSTLFTHKRCYIYDHSTLLIMQVGTEIDGLYYLDDSDLSGTSILDVIRNPLGFQQRGSHN